jgi:hypothetical protein
MINHTDSPKLRFQLVQPWKGLVPMATWRRQSASLRATVRCLPTTICTSAKITTSPSAGPLIIAGWSNGGRGGFRKRVAPRSGLAPVRHLILQFALSNRRLAFDLFALLGC